MKPTLWPAWNGSSCTAFCWANSRRRNSCLTPRYSALPRWENQQPTGKTWAFFSITSNNLVTVRKGSDYVARMIEMAGGSYVFADLTDSGNNLATINLSLEDFYAGAKDADVLLYNSTIEGSIASTEQLVEKCPLLAQFKAVQNGNVWCTAQSCSSKAWSFRILILDMNRVFTKGTPADSELTFLTHVE